MVVSWRPGGLCGCVVAIGNMMWMCDGDWKDKVYVWWKLEG